MLFESQENYLARLGDKPYIFAGTGAGKTRMSMIRAKRAGFNKVLIITTATVRDTKQWEKERDEIGIYFDDFQVEGFSFIQKYGKIDFTKYSNYYIIIDECFIGETLVQTDKGDRQIRDVKIGDKVQSYNHETSRVELKTVTRLVKKEYTGKYYCIFSSHGAIIATYNHPVMTQDGYKMAQDIVEGDTIYERVDSSKQNTQVRGNPEVQVLREHTSGEGLESKTGAAISRKELADMQRDMRSKIVGDSFGKTSQQESQQSSGSSKSESDLKGEWDSFTNLGEGQDESAPQRREWAYIPLATISLREVRQSEQRLDYGAANTDKRAQECTSVSDLLQSRYRERLLQACGRVRWTKPPRASEIQRQEEGRKIRAARVERVAVLEREDIARYGLSSEPNTVYCIEVEDNSNFFANDMLVHNCHKIKNSQSQQGIGAFKLCAAAGAFCFLSATPMSKWADAVNYAKITGLVKHKTEFYRRFVIEQPSYSHKGKDIVGYRDTDTLVRWWSSIALRGHAEEFVELPKKQVIDVEIPIRRQRYINMVKTRMDENGEPLDSAPKLTWALRAYAEMAPEKLLWVVEKVEGVENCLIFVNTIAALEELSIDLKYRGIKHGVWYGKKKDNFEDQTVMIVQYQSGGTGLNLQKFSTTIFLSPTYSYTDYHQAVGRTYRTGQTERCTFYQLKAKNTIDEAIYNSLSQKKNFDTNLTNVPEDSWSELMGL